jgi:hypothetical protein
MSIKSSIKLAELLRRRVRQRNGVTEEWSAAMGRVITIAADPQPRRIDVSADAPGWERVRTLRMRLRRRG